MASAGVAGAAPSRVSVFESRDHAATTEGDAILATDPDTAYRLATDFRSWPRIFPTIQNVRIAKSTRDGVEVAFTHRDGSVDRLRFRNAPARHEITFQQLDGDADVSAEIVFAAGDVAGTTRVHSRLYADVHGLASAFVGDSELRDRRQQQVRDDLGHLQAYFAASRP